MWDVASVAFTGDGRTLASGSADATVRLWDVRTHKQLGTSLPGQRSANIGSFEPASPVASSPDGRTLASVSTDDTVRLWEKILWRNFDELQTEVCNLVGSGLNTAEWAQYATGIPHHQSCP